jgi:ribosomal protein S27E
MPVTIQCKDCGYILYRGRDIVIVKPGRNSSYSVLEALIGSRCPVCGRVLCKPGLGDIEIRVKQKKPLEALVQ